MVTQAVGGAATRSISVVLSARDDGTVGRVFGRVGRELQGTADQLTEVRARQRELTRELRGVERGSVAYRELEQQIEDAKREAKRLTDEIEEQQRQWGRLTGRADRYGQTARASLAAVGVAAGALIFTVNEMGERMGQALAITGETGLAIEEVQRLQNALSLVGRDLDANDLQEFAVRIGDAQQQMTEGVGPVFEALTRLGLPIRDLGAKDLPLVLERLQQIPDAATRAFEADEILGGQLAESFRFYWALPDDVRAQMEDASVLTERQAEELLRAAAAAKTMGTELRYVGVTAAAALQPALEGMLDVLTPIVQAVGDFAAANPFLVQSLAALGAGIATITTILWAYNAAKAAALALSGPQGWLILGVAAGLLSAGGIAFAVGRQRQREQTAGDAAIQRLEAQYGAAAQQQQMAAVRTGSEAGVREGIARASQQVSQRQLSGILPGVSPGTPAAAAAADEAKAAVAAAVSDVIKAEDAGLARQQVLASEARVRRSLPSGIDRHIDRLDRDIARLQAEFEDPTTNAARLAVVTATLEARQERRDELAARRAGAYAASAIPNLEDQAAAVRGSPDYVPFLPRRNDGSTALWDGSLAIRLRVD